MINSEAIPLKVSYILISIFLPFSGSISENDLAVDIMLFDNLSTKSESCMVDLMVLIKVLVNGCSLFYRVLYAFLYKEKIDPAKVTNTGVANIKNGNDNKDKVFKLGPIDLASKIDLNTLYETDGKFLSMLNE